MLQVGAKRIEEEEEEYAHSEEILNYWMLLIRPELTE
jgi:hypothetical protein